MCVCVCVCVCFQIDAFVRKHVWHMYIQTLGTAMGTKIAPTYTTLFQAYKEENLYEMIGKKIRQQHKRKIYLIIEKIFGWLLHILETPMGRHQRITQPTAKLTSQNKIYYWTQLKIITIFRHPYKNVKVQIITDINPKPTDTQQYLHFKSHHPKNCINSIPYTLARRIHTIITDKNLKKTHL